MKVRITAKQTVTFNQVVEMTAKEWADLKKMDGKERAIQLIMWLDMSDIHDGEDVEDIEADRLKGDKSVESIDCY